MGIKDKFYQIISFLVFVMALLVLGCVEPTNHENDIKDATMVVESLMSKVNNGDFEHIQEYYSTDFFKDITQVQWVNDLKKMLKLNGPTKDKKLITADIQEQSGKTYIVLTYVCRYEKDSSRNKFALISDSCLNQFTVTQENMTYKIVGHKIKL